jgi:hypothetical protein
VEALVAKLDTLTKDSKFATLIAHAREHVLAGQRIVVFCRQIATAAYLHEALDEEWPDHTTGRIVASTALAERWDALERWRARGGVLIAGLGIAGDADLSSADLAVAYDPVAERERLERIWGSVDRPGRRTPPTLALLQPAERSRIAAETPLFR